MLALGPSDLSFLSCLLMSLLTPLWVAAVAAIVAWLAGAVRRHLPRRGT